MFYGRELGDGHRYPWLLPHFDVHVYSVFRVHLTTPVNSAPPRESTKALFPPVAPLDIVRLEERFACSGTFVACLVDAPCAMSRTVGVEIDGDHRQQAHDG